MNLSPSRFLDHHHQHEETQQAASSTSALSWWLHMCSASLLLLLVATGGCIMPFFLQKKIRSSNKTIIFTALLGVINAFAGGAFVGFGLFHLLPESIEQLGEAEYDIFIKGESTKLLPFLLAYLGYSLMMFLDYIVSCNENTMNGHHKPPLCGSPSFLSLVAEATSGSNIIAIRPSSHDSVGNGASVWVGEKPVKTASNECEEDCCVATVRCKSCVDGFDQVEVGLEDEKRGKEDDEQHESKKADGTEGHTGKADDLGNKKTTPTAADREGMYLMDNVKRKKVGSRSWKKKERYKYCENNALETLTTKRNKVLANLKKIVNPAFLMCLSLTMHSVLEGIVVGTCNRVSDVWITTTVIVGHKAAAGFSLAAVFAQRNLSFSECLPFLICFVISSPLGVAIGAGAAADSNIVAGFLTALSTGTVFYIGNEVVAAELSSGKRGLMFRIVKFGGFLFGSMTVFVLGLVHSTVGHHHHS